MTEFRLPSLGADMDEATILEWRVGPGDALVPGEVAVVIDTEKSEMDVEVLHPGTVTELLVPVGATVPVGTVLARYEAAGAVPAGAVPAGAVPAGAVPAGAPRPTDRVPADAEPAGAGPAGAPPAGAPRPTDRVPADAEPAGAGPGGPPPAGVPRPTDRVPADPVPAAAPAAAVPAGAPGDRRGAGRVAASPLARRRAAEEGLELASLRGTGPGGAVVARDVVRPRPGRDRGRRHAIGALMARAKREIPHYYLDDDLDLGPALDRLRRLNADRPVADRLVPAALLLRATALAAAGSPQLNGHLVDGTYRPAERVDLGTAISLRGGGLVAPAILGADRMGLDELMAALRDVVARARAGRLRPAELADATITVTNLGDQGVRRVLPVIVPPQVAMVGFGRIAERPVVRDGTVQVSPGVTVSLAADHRVSDGLTGARFLRRLAGHLDDLDQLFDPGEGP